MNARACCSRQQEYRSTIAGAADDGSMDVELELPPASAGMHLYSTPLIAASPAAPAPGSPTRSPRSSAGTTPSSENSLDHYSGSSFCGKGDVSTHGSAAGAHGSPPMHGRGSHARHDAPAHGDGGQPVGEKANGVPVADSACFGCRHRPFSGSPARDAAASRCLKAAPAGDRSPSHQRSSSLQSSPTWQLTQALASCPVSTADAATQVADVAAPKQDELLSTDSVVAARNSPTRRARDDGCAASGSQKGTSMTARKTRRRPPRKETELPPVLPFVGSPPPSERHIPKDERSVSHSTARSMTHSMTHSSRSPSPTLTSRSLSPPVTSYAEAYARSQAAKRRHAASMEDAATDAPFLRTPAEPDAPRVQARSSRWLRSGSQGARSRRTLESPASRVLRTLRTLRGRGSSTPEPQCSCTLSADQLQPADVSTGTGAHRRGASSTVRGGVGGGSMQQWHGSGQVDAVDLGCWGGDTGGFGGGGCGLMDHVCGLSPRRRRPGSPAGPLQRSVSEWKSACSQCGAPRISGGTPPAPAPASPLRQTPTLPERAARPATRHRTCTHGRVQELVPSRVQNPALLGASALHSVAGDGGAQKRGVCIGLDTLHSATQISTPDPVSVAEQSRARTAHEASYLVERHGDTAHAYAGACAGQEDSAGQDMSTDLRREHRHEAKKAGDAEEFESGVHTAALCPSHYRRGNFRG